MSTTGVFLNRCSTGMWSLIFFFIVLESRITSGQSDDCRPERVSQCIPQMRDFMENQQTPFATSEAELDVICLTFNAEIECMERYISMCYSPEEKEMYNRLRDNSAGIIDDLCMEGTYRTEYLEHVQCFNDSSSNYKQCVRSYHHFLQESLSGSDPISEDADKSLVRFCCAFSEFITCTYEKVLQFCDFQTVKFFKEFLARSTVPIFEGHCANYTVGSPFCSSASSLRFAVGRLQLYGVFPLLLLMALKSSLLCR